MSTKTNTWLNKIINAADKKLYEIWESEGIPCSYVRFQQAVPRSFHTEPVGEFKLTLEDKYKVDKITYTPHGVIWRSGGEVDIAPLPDVMYARFIV